MINLPEPVMVPFGLSAMLDIAEKSCRLMMSRDKLPAFSCRHKQRDATD